MNEERAINTIKIIFFSIIFSFTPPCIAKILFNSVTFNITVLIIFSLIFIGRFFIVHNKLNVDFHLSEEAEANIEIMMRKRLDLLRQLTSVANKYAIHERDISFKISNDKKINDVFVYVTLAANLYPDLKADQIYIKLMNEYNDIANQVQIYFEKYNSFVRNYNTNYNYGLNSTFAYNIFYNHKMLDYLKQSAWKYTPTDIVIKELKSNT